MNILDVEIVVGKRYEVQLGFPDGIVWSHGKCVEISDTQFVLHPRMLEPTDKQLAFVFDVASVLSITEIDSL